METKERLMFKYALGGIVLSTSLHSAALSLGASSGQAIIGRTLDMQVRSDAPLADIESAGCVSAQVQYGDTQLPAGNVSLSVQAAGSGATIRVRTSVPVNEPVVSVVLNTGCAADRFTRKYTLLADLDPTLTSSSAVAAVPLVVLAPPTDNALARPSGGDLANAGGLPALPSPPMAASTPMPAPAPAPAPVAQESLRPPAPRPQASAPPAARPRPAPRPAAATPPKKRVAPVRKAPPATDKQVAAPEAAPKATTPAPVAAQASAGPRLKLDPVDLSPGRNPGLKLNTELLSQPAANEADRTSASELWAALNTPPEKAAEDARRLAAMEADLKALREQQAGLQASMAALTAQLQAERDERAPKALVYALVAALVLAAAALAWLLSERRRQRAQLAPGDVPWWQSAHGADAPSSLPATAPPQPSGAPVAVPAPAPVVMASAASLDEAGVEALDVSEATESSFAQLMADAPVSMEALLDLLQQVEFFDSLQQQADAAMVLEQFVEEHGAACELPHLLLMQQAQTQGETDRLRELGARYQLLFGAPAPDASCHTRGQAGLETQSKFMDVLTRFWPGDQALDLLRNTLLAPPGTGLLEKHSLQAFEDALLLYSVAQTLKNDTDLRGPGPAVVAATSAVASVASEAAAPAAQADVAPAEGLDLDLSFSPEHELPPSAEAPAVAADPDRRELPMLDFDLFALESKDNSPPAKS